MNMRESLWSLRMRASRTVKHQASGVKGEIHISGAEGLYDSSQIAKITRDYLLRAMNHPKGHPDKVVITAERMRRKPVVIPLLPFSTVQCDSTDEARRVLVRLLSGSGISRKAIQNALRVITGRTAMHGAAMMRAESAFRVEPEKERGIRVSRLGVRKDEGRRLSRMLSSKGINTSTVKEAIILASKVASCRGVVAELCVSDDPDYTTGYIASKRSGYVRIPNIKKKGSISGGRVFFIDEKVDVKKMIEYLERTPVVVGKVSLE